MTRCGTWSQACGESALVRWSGLLRSLASEYTNLIRCIDSCSRLCPTIVYWLLCPCTTWAPHARHVIIIKVDHGAPCQAVLPWTVCHLELAEAGRFEFLSVFFLNYVCVPQAVCGGGRQQQHRRHKPDDHQFRGAIFQERCSQGGHGPEQGLGCSGPPAGSLSCWLLGPPLSHHVEGGGEQWQGLISGPPNRNRIIALHRLPTSPPYSPTWFWSPCSSVVSRCLAPSRASCSTSHQSGPSSSTSRSEKESSKFDCFYF